MHVGIEIAEEHEVVLDEPNRVPLVEGRDGQLVAHRVALSSRERGLRAGDKRTGGSSQLCIHANQLLSD